MSFYNAAAWLIDRHVRDGRGGRVAVRCKGESTTYEQLQHELFRAQRALVDLNIGEGDRIALVLRDDLAFPAWFLGAQRSGVVPIALSTMLTAADLATIVADAGARVLVISDAWVSSIAEIVEGAPTIESVVIAGDGGATQDCSAELHRWSTFTHNDEMSVAETTRDSSAFWLYSSGTTGQPKGVMHRHGSPEATVSTYADQVLNITENDRFLSIAKLFFAYGLGNSLTFPFAVGATAILHPDPPTPAAMVELIAQEKATLFFASPGFVAAILDAEPPSSAFATLRGTVTAGESLPANFQTRFATLTGQPVLDGIGSTELLHIFISNTLEVQTPGTSGSIVPGYVAELRDDNGDRVTEPDTPGYLHVQGPTAASGYWERPEASAAAFHDGWVRTGDVYTRSAADHWTFLGRNNDMIKAGGIWVSPAEVESVLVDHPQVLEAAVIGSRSEGGLEMTVAYVVPASGIAPEVEQLQQHCRDNMAAFKRPAEIHIVDGLPKTATGKIRRFALRTERDAQGTP